MIFQHGEFIAQERCSASHGDRLREQGGKEDSNGFSWAVGANLVQGFLASLRDDYDKILRKKKLKRLAVQKTINHFATCLNQGSNLRPRYTVQISF